MVFQMVFNVNKIKLYDIFRGRFCIQSTLNKSRFGRLNTRIFSLTTTKQMNHIRERKELNGYERTVLINKIMINGWGIYV